MKPKSCDTFVVLPDVTKDACTIFGKNSDRPSTEVQEIIYVAAADHEEATVKCTYIEVSQVSHTHAVILSKPSWMWGAEMGSNEHSVCIGNEAIWTKQLSDEDNVKKLLGMDLLRLGLERGNTANEALHVITSLLEKYGQGGPCSEEDADFVYHNSFIICDPNEAWVLETAGCHWAAEMITSGYRNISNCLSIGTKIDITSAKLKEHACNMGWWDGTSTFNFSKVYASTDEEDCSRKQEGAKLLAKFSHGSQFNLENMFTILRDEESGICLRDGSFITTSSQVSILKCPNSRQPSCHWFTGTPDPMRSVFKPFIFTPNVKISPHIQTPNSSKRGDRSHKLYRCQQADTGSDILKTLQELEKNCVHEMESYLASFLPEKLTEVDELFKDAVESELKFYN